MTREGWELHGQVLRRDANRLPRAIVAQGECRQASQGNTFKYTVLLGILSFPESDLCIGNGWDVWRSQINPGFSPLHTYIVSCLFLKVLSDSEQFSEFCAR